MMSNEKQESVADIVADIRERAENAMRNGERLVHNEAVAMLLRSIVDRLEAARKRDYEYPKSQSLDADKLTGKNISELTMDLRQISKYHYARGNIVQGQFCRVMADRIEAAAAREKAQPGNAAAMREALVQCELFLGNVSRHGHPTLNPGDKCTACDGVDELREMVVRALAAPPRNCDVGTPDEQAKRFNDFCSTHICNTCVVHDKMAHSFNDGIPERAFSCRLVFSQLPYEAEEGAGK